MARRNGGTHHMKTPTHADTACHVLSVIGGFNPNEGVHWHGDKVVFARSYRDSCRQCYMGTVKAEAWVTMEELLLLGEPYWGWSPDATEPEVSYETDKVVELLNRRWDEDIAAKRAKGYRYE